MNNHSASGVRIHAELPAEYRELLSSGALDFIADLQRRFGAAYQQLAAEYADREAAFKQQRSIDFPSETADIRASEWTIGPSPILGPLQDRRVELVTATDRTALDAALNSNASLVTARMETDGATDLQHVLTEHLNVREALAGVIGRETLTNAAELGDDAGVPLAFEPRPWTLREESVHVDGEPVQAALFDVGLFFFANQGRFVGENKGCFLHLPRLHGHREALLWNELFVQAQDAHSLPRGKIKVTVPIETVTAAFEMHEILYALREHAAALSYGHQAYLAHLRALSGVTAERQSDTDSAPCLRALAQLLVKTCHRRGAYAIGGLTETASAGEETLARIREEKAQEAGDGFDGSRVAHVDLVPLLHEVFDHHLGGARVLHEERADIVPGAHDVFADSRQGPNQLGVMREDFEARAEDLLALS